MLPFISFRTNRDAARTIFPEGCPVLDDHYLSNFKIENEKQRQ